MVCKRYTHSHTHLSCLAANCKLVIVNCKICLLDYQPMYCATQIVSAQKIAWCTPQFYLIWVTSGLLVSGSNSSDLVLQVFATGYALGKSCEVAMKIDE